MKRTLIIATAILVVLFGLYQLSTLFAPGSYPYAEIYELNAPEKNVVEAIVQFKSAHPEFVVPYVSVNNYPAGNLSESEGRKENSHWYFVYFYYPKENKIVFTWTRPSSKNKTDFAFVSLNNGKDLGHWKRINHDLGFFENRKAKKTFEERILSEIQSRLKTKLTLL